MKALPVLLAASLPLLAACTRAGAQAAGAPEDCPPGGPGGVVAAGAERWVDLADFLPDEHARDGSVDYTLEVQAAIDAAAGGTLRLPDFPLLVSRRPDRNWCLLIGAPLKVLGSPSSALVEREGAVQILRAADVGHLVLRDFALHGAGGQGQGLAHGLLQVTGGSDVRIDGVRVFSSDADGIAVSNVCGVQVSHCIVDGASKSGIYLADCTDGVVTANLVTRFGGHRTSAGSVVGTGIQLSSSRHVVCSDNVVRDGVGIGILCNAFANGPKPEGNVLSGNRVEDVGNPANPSISGGIRCANGNADKATHTLVEGNLLRDCGAHGIWIENHGGSAVLANSVVESWGSGILVGTVEDLALVGNVVLNSGVVGGGASAGLELTGLASGVRARDNVLCNSDLYRPTLASENVIDGSAAGGNDLEPRTERGEGPPSSGSWRAGDVVRDASPQRGGWVGWVCVQAGSPGVWAPFGRID